MRTAWFIGWAVVGAVGALGVLALLSIGVVLLLAAAALAGVLLVRGARRRIGAGALIGLVSGAGLPLLYVAFLNRAGPGTVCMPTADGERCDQLWSPTPFAVAGLLLLLVGLVSFGYVEQRRKRSTVQSLR